ncbi:hypothetical protein LCGC14_0629180 [marine sediment metagenome]|uniref:Uncharacterized protein n=1 Tax=marine sediment metagenome TaxID=412755 RepID=A0A0F9R7P7_9ZZZZ
MKYPYITINVEYDPNEREEDMDFDNVLDEIAKKHGGEHSGGGFMLSTGMRDQDFDFSDLKQAHKFALAVKRFKEVNMITSHCMLHDNDF